MKYSVSPEFTQKIISSPSTVPAVASFVKLVEGGTKEEILESRYVSEIAPKVLYTYQDGGTRIFFTFVTEVEDSEVILLVDVISQEVASTSGGGNPQRDPKRNASINPVQAQHLNPRFNSSLNPRFNTSINPRFNSTINPKFNSSINPRFNSAINPRFNSSINPRYNYNLNPAKNWSINPARNSLFSGILLYDLKANKTGFALKANEKVFLLFNNQCEHTGIAVTTIKGCAVFDNSNNWVQSWIEHQYDGYLIFDTANTWVGFVII